MVTAVIVSPQGETSGQRFALPSCAPSVLTGLARIARTVEQAQLDGQTIFKITFHVHRDRVTRVELTSLTD